MDRAHCVRELCMRQRARDSSGYPAVVRFAPRGVKADSPVADCASHGHAAKILNAFFE
jgi:hypothetical protein